MKTVKEVSQCAGVSVRTLHHYDAIGLLKPTQLTGSGYRLYDDAALERLSMILVLRELGLSLRQIQETLDAPDFDRDQVLSQQILLMDDKVKQLQNRIHLAKCIQQTGGKYMDFEHIDSKNFDEYSQQAKTLYGKTDAYKEYTQKSQGRSKEQEATLGHQVMDLFAELGKLRHLEPGCAEVQAWVAGLQQFFTQHYYHCTPQILKSLGQTYAGGGSMTEHIDVAGGKGTAEFAKQAIDIYCK